MPPRTNSFTQIGKNLYILIQRKVNDRNLILNIGKMKISI